MKDKWETRPYYIDQEYADFLDRLDAEIKEQERNFLRNFEADLYSGGVKIYHEPREMMAWEKEYDRPINKIKRFFRKWYLRFRDSLRVLIGKSSVRLKDNWED